MIHKQTNTSNHTKSIFKFISAVIISALVSQTSMAGEMEQKQAKMKKIKMIMGSQMKMMKPQLQKQVKGLSPKTKKSLMKILAQHSRHSNSVTLRQVMIEVLSDYQSVIAGIMMENPEQTASSARRLANHRIPVGGLLPYLGLENINDDRLAILEAFNDSVEGNALKLATAAEAGDMTNAAILLGPISAGCVACHDVFRSKPGVSNLLR